MKYENEIDSVLMNRTQNEIRHEIKRQVFNDRIITNDSRRIIPVTLVFDWMNGEIVREEQVEKIVPHALCLTLLIDWDKNLIFFEAETWLHLEEILEGTPLTLYQRSVLMGIYSLNGKNLRVKSVLSPESCKPKTPRIENTLLKVIGLILLLSLAAIGCGGSDSSDQFLEGAGQESIGETQNSIVDHGEGEVERIPEKPACSTTTSGSAPRSSAGDCRKGSTIVVPGLPTTEGPSTTTVPPSSTTVDPTGPSTDPSTGPDTPIPAISCPGKREEDFDLAEVRFHFYTAKRRGAETNHAVSFSPIGKSLSRGDMEIIPLSETSLPGKTEQGALDTVLYRFPDLSDVSSGEFSKIKIALSPHVETPFGPLSVDDPWFLGALYVEGLKKGCDARITNHWTPLYFNPFLRTWVSRVSPLIVSEEDTVAIFEASVGGVGILGSEGGIWAATPFETKDLPSYTIQETPVLNYENTSDFQRGGKYFYGRSYFAESQAWAVNANSRLKGRFSELRPEDLSKGFKIRVVDAATGIYFDHFTALLIRPIFEIGSLPFEAYIGQRYDFWVNPFWGCLFSPCSLEEDLPFLYPKKVTNLGVGIADNTPLGFLNWAIQKDNPGDI